MFGCQRLAGSVIKRALAPTVDVDFADRRRSAREPRLAVAIAPPTSSLCLRALACLPACERTYLTAAAAAAATCCAVCHSTKRNHEILAVRFHAGNRFAAAFAAAAAASLAALDQSPGCQYKGSRSASNFERYSHYANAANDHSAKRSGGGNNNNFLLRFFASLPPRIASHRIALEPITRLASVGPTNPRTNERTDERQVNVRGKCAGQRIGLTREAAKTCSCLSPMNE